MRPRASAALLLGGLVAVGGACSSQPHQEISVPTTATDTTVAVVTGEPEAVEAPAVALEMDVDPDTLYVDPVGGDDGADGQTAETAWRSLQVALGRLQAGQTLYLRGGEYRAPLDPDVAAHFVVRTGGTAEDWTTITAAPGESPVIVATEANAIEVRADYVEVSGIEIRGEGFGRDNDYGWGVLVRDAHHVRLRDDTVSGMAVGGLAAVESSNLELIDNEIFENSFWGPEQGSGISLWHLADHGQEPAGDGYAAHIIGNRVYRNENKVDSEFRDVDIKTDGNGIIIDQADETGYSGRVLVANNVVFDNGGRGILVLESSRVDVMFNTTYHNGRTGDDLEGGPVELAAGRANDVRFLNNLAWSRSGAPAFGASEATDVELGGNVFVTDDPSGLATGLDTVVDGDPGLVNPDVDPDTADFSPLPDSLVLGEALLVSPSLPFDVDGNPRKGTTVGAYELTS